MDIDGGLIIVKMCCTCIYRVFVKESSYSVRLYHHQSKMEFFKFRATLHAQAFLCALFADSIRRTAPPLLVCPLESNGFGQSYSRIKAETRDWTFISTLHGMPGRS